MMLSIYGMIVDLVQKPSDAVGVLVQSVLITTVWCGSGGSEAVTGMIRVALTITVNDAYSYCVFFFVMKHVAKYDTFFLLFGILNISQVMRSPVILYGIH